MQLDVGDALYIGIVRQSANPNDWYWSVKRPFGDPKGYFGWESNKRTAEAKVKAAMQKVYTEIFG